MKGTRFRCVSFKRNLAFDVDKVLALCTIRPESMRIFDYARNDAFPRRSSAYWAPTTLLSTSSIISPLATAPV